MSLTRQERRRRERQAKKQGEEKQYEMNLTMLQPWSTPVMKTKLPSEVIHTMTEISDKVLADKNAESWGGNLAGQIETELVVEHDILKQTKMMGFFMGAVRQFVLMCKCQQMPDLIEAVKQEEWLTQLLTMWVVSQYPNEYNPAHLHTQCQVSAVMYLKMPEMLSSRKEHRGTDDGSILFMGQCSRDLDLAAPQLTCKPVVGDFYFFPNYLMHCVYPFNRMVVNAYGHVTACTADFLDRLWIGDTRKHTLAEIWLSDKYRYFRRRHLCEDYKGLNCDACIRNLSDKCRNNSDDDTTTLEDAYTRDQL